MAIESGLEVHVLVKFRVPPGQPPQSVATQIARSGLSVAMGLVQYLISLDANVVPSSTDSPPPEGQGPKIVI